MALRIKQSIINATEFRSDGLGVLASIAWAAETVGRYRGTVRRGDAAVASFELEVDKGGAASQLDIDLNDLAGASLGGARAARRFQVASAEGQPAYVQFFVSDGPGGYQVVIEGAKANFDSRSLGPRDVFTTVLVRPGLYTMEHKPSGAKGEIAVERLEQSEKGYEPQAHQVRVTARGFDPPRLAIRGAGDVSIPRRLGSRAERPARRRRSLSANAQQSPDRRRATSAAGRSRLCVRGCTPAGARRLRAAPARRSREGIAAAQAHEVVCGVAEELQRRGVRLLRIAGRDGVDERAVLGERALAVAALGADTEALAERQREHLRHRPEELVVGRDVDRAMESEIGVDEGLLVRRLGHPGEGEADLLDVRRLGRRRGERRGGRLDGEAELEQLLEIGVEVRDLEPPAQHVGIEVVPVLGVGHPIPTLRLRFEEALADEHPDRLAHRGAAHPHHVADAQLGGQRIARPDVAAQDADADLVGEARVEVAPKRVVEGEQRALPSARYRRAGDEAASGGPCRAGTLVIQKN